MSAFNTKANQRMIVSLCELESLRNGKLGKENITSTENFTLTYPPQSII